MTDPLIVKDLWKTYKVKSGDVHAVEGISFSVKKGEIFGLLGPNGAGKTTTINMLIGILSPDKGDILFFGEPRSETTQERINATTAYTSLNGHLTVEENLRFYAMIYNVKDAEHAIAGLLKRFNIYDIRDQRVFELSSGQKTRANLCKALINNPDILFLDEATAGLDPDIAFEVREEIKKLECTIVFTSHIMREVEELCDRVAFVKNGRIVAVDSPAKLKKKLNKKTMEEVFLHLTKHA